MTTQPTVAAIQKKGVVSAIDLATTAGATQAMGVPIAASVIARTDWVNSHKDATQKVVDDSWPPMNCIRCTARPTSPTSFRRRSCRTSW